MSLYDQYLQSSQEDEEDKIDLYSEYNLWKNETPSQKASDKVQPDVVQTDFQEEEPEKKSLWKKITSGVKSVFEPKETPRESFEKARQMYEAETGQKVTQEQVDSLSAKLMESSYTSPNRGIDEAKKKETEYENYLVATILQDKYFQLGLAKQEGNEKNIDKYTGQIKEIETALDDPMLDPLSLQNKKNIVSKYAVARAGRAGAAGAGGMLAGTIGTSEFVNEWLGEQASKIKEDKNMSEHWEEKFSKFIESSGVKAERAKKARQSIQRWATEVMPSNATSSEQLVAGAGSTVPFMVVSFLTGGIGAAVGANVLLESLSEAGAVYGQLRDEGQSVNEADENFAFVFGANVLFNAVTDRLGLPQEIQDKLNKTGTKNAALWQIIEPFKVGGAEGFQEWYQSIVSEAGLGNIKTADDLVNVATSKESLTEGGFGFLIGSTTTAAINSVYSLRESNPELVEQVDEKLSDLRKRLEENATIQDKEKLQPVLDEAYKQTIKNGGVTISLEGNKPTEGYAYSPYKDSETVYEKESFTEDNIGEFVDKFFDRLSEEGNHLGIWEDGGKIYIDISQVGEATEETISKAEKAGQLAVFDLKNFSTVYTKLGQQQQQIQDEKTNITNIPEGEKEGAVGIRDMGSISEVPAVTTKAEAGTKTTKAGVTKTTQKKLTSQEKTKEELGKRVSERGTIKFRETPAVNNINNVLKSYLKPISNIEGAVNEGKNQIRYISPDGTPYSLRKAGGGLMGSHEMEIGRMGLDINDSMENGLLRVLVSENKDGVKSLLIENKVDLNEKQLETIKEYFPDYEVVVEKTKLGSGTNATPVGEAIVADKGENIKEVIGGEETRKAIEEYQKESTSKFRTEEELLQEKDRGMTTKFLELPDIKGKSFLSKSLIQNLSVSKGVGLKAYEFSVIQDVLNNQFADVDKINMIDFRKAVLSQMMPLDVIESDTYANYGIDNIGMDYSVGGEDAPKTYIFNSPFDHGNTGHFSQDFQSEEVSKKDVEIREVPIGDKTKFVVVKNGESLTEDNIEENVFTVTNTKEEAESWIEKHSVKVPVFKDGEENGYKAKYIRTKMKGLFGHFRATVQNAVSYILEIQSDAFQKGVGLYAEIRDTEERIKNMKEDLGRKETSIIVAKAQEEVAESGSKKLDLENWGKVYQKEVNDLSKKIDDAETTLAQLKAREISKEEKVFNTYKNIWQERLVREAINIKANEGSEFIRFPTPRTVAVIEGFTGGEEGNTMPYEIINGDEESGLVDGDSIDYGGDTYTVVWADGYSITAAPESDVIIFNVDDYIDERVNADFEDIKYNFENVVEKYGKNIDTIGDVNNILKTQETLNRLHQYSKIDKNTKEEIDLFEGGERADYRFNISHIKDTIGEWERFAELIKNDIVHKENITKENAQNLDFKDNLVKKYRLPMHYWYHIESAYRIWDVSKDIGIDEVSKNVIFDIEANIKEQKENLSISEDRLERATEIHQVTLDGIKNRKKPTAKELKGIPQEMIDKATDPDSYTFGYNIDYQLEGIFKEEIEKATGVDGVIDEEAIFSLDDLSDEWISDRADDFDIDDDLSGTYNEYFVDDNRENAYAIVSGNSESFSQPDQYDKTSSIEDFNIEDYSDTEKTVLEFYNKQVIPYLKKLRSDLKLVDDENGYQWWESELTEKDKDAPTAYRVKDDFEQIGITITDKQEKQIMKLNKNMFGDASVKITEQILSNNKALGAYSKKIIQILSGQVNPKDTFYHEAVHKYIDVFLTKDEQTDLFMAGAKKYKTNDIAKVEEMIAEDFISYAKSREGVTGKIKSIFDKIISRIQSYLGNQDIIEETYSDILKPYEDKLKPKKITKTAQSKEEAKVVKETVPTLVPVGEGEVRVSKLSKGVEARAVAEKLIKSFGDLPEYQRVSVDNQAERATKLINEDWDTAVNIALGREESPYGLLPESVFIAVENKALEDGSVDLLRQLATSPRTSEATAMGQRIRMLAERNPDSAVNNIREVYNERKKASEKRGYRKDKEVANLKKEVDNEVKKVSKYDWKSFIDSIEC